MVGYVSAESVYIATRKYESNKLVNKLAVMDKDKCFAKIKINYINLTSRVKVY